MSGLCVPCNPCVTDLGCDIPVCTQVTDVISIYPLPGDNDGCDIQVFIPGPIGPVGPVGPTGPQGPMGSSSGPFVIVTTSSSIPTGQSFTIVNASAINTQTLPAVSSVVTSGTTSQYIIYNVNAYAMTIQGTGGDQVQFGSNLVVLFGKTSVTLLAVTGLGWIIV